MERFTYLLTFAMEVGGTSDFRSTILFEDSNREIGGEKPREWECGWSGWS
ncbi:hypothetical protein Scep_027956 [Stephania cephalantha]|uniref:Uncharacterized protein n=1 Tax=Stephania cephalantha TaxID=152367 RepID=A0AAP0HJ20_9MAGN